MLIKFSRIRRGAKQLRALYSVKTEPNSAPKEEKPLEPLKILLNQKGVDDDEEEVVEVSEETAKLGRSLAFKALGIATLINIAAAIIFVLVMRYYYGFLTIKEFKASLNEIILKMKANMRPTVNQIQQASSGLVKDIDVKSYLTTEEEEPKKQDTEEASKRWELIKDTFKKKSV